MDIQEAKEIAIKYQRLLLPWCEEGMCCIAGSIRRGKEDIGDIEIVCVPRTCHLVPFVTVVKQWVKMKGDPAGRYTQRLLQEGILLDLFIPQKKDFVRQFVIRTGSAEFASRMIASSWVKKGWRGTSDGLRLENECVSKGKLWICNLPHPQLPPEWKTEEEFFDWLGIKFIQPQHRNL